MLEDKSLLKDFDLVEELDSQAAETISGGVDTFPLFCRGGVGDVLFSVDQGQVKYNFTRGTQAAPVGVPSGSCSWGDRGVVSEEPNQLLFSISLPGASNLILSLSDPERTAVVQAYNDRQGSLRVERIGPS